MRCSTANPYPAGYRAEIEVVYDLVDVWGADVSAELHFNASTAAAASGTETWYASEAGRVLAERVNAALVRVLGLPDRGLKKAGRAIAKGIDGTRGYESLICGRCPAVLIESYFGSNAGDCLRADAVIPSLPRRSTPPWPGWRRRLRRLHAPPRSRSAWRRWRPGRRRSSCVWPRSRRTGDSAFRMHYPAGEEERCR